ncbi:MAG: ATP-binding cassette domain-containing protein [Clostridia bacterium]|nr:ATP-binding cassette domain-containing protein [Clostridia bacterium]
MDKVNEEDKIMNAESAAGPIFVSTNITKRFGQTIALNNVDISIYPGEIRGFIGENGSGKSTMAAIMTGIYDKTGGTMRYHGREWAPASMVDALRGGIGIVVQESGTIPEISVAENMYLGELRNFCGVHFFEERKVENFSPSFDAGILTKFDEKAEEGMKKVRALLKDGESAYYEAKTEISLLRKDSVTAKDERDAKIAELTKRAAAAKRTMKRNAATLREVRRELKDELKDMLADMTEVLKDMSTRSLSEFVRRYNEEAQGYFDSFRAKIEESEKKYEAIYASCEDTELERRRHDSEVKEIRKEYASRIRALDRRHEGFLLWQKHNVRSLINHYKNAVRDLFAPNEASLRRKVRRGVLTAVFGAFVNRAKLNKYAQLALSRIGINNIVAGAPCGAYDMQDRKLIEIAKCLNKSPEIFIVDETTTALSETGRALLYKCMNDLKNEGKSVLFVSHDLDEIMDKCDTLTVLRDGNIVANLDKAKGEFDPDVILKAMIGRELKGDYYRTDFDGSCGEEVVLRMVDGIEAGELKHVSMELHKGEILGIGGLSECGMHTLGKALFGAVKMEGGFVYAGDGRPVTSEVVAMGRRIGYLPKNRDTEGLTQKDSVFNNIAIASLNNIAKLNLFVFKSAERKVVTREVRDLSIKCNSPNDLVSSLSGGNKQKVSLGKWIGNDSQILILDCPTRGVDIGVKQFIYQLMYRMKTEGRSIVMISEELPELIGMSDRILIMKDGEVTKEFRRSPDLTQEQIIKYMI